MVEEMFSMPAGHGDRPCRSRAWKPARECPPSGDRSPTQTYLCSSEGTAPPAALLRHPPGKGSSPANPGALDGDLSHRCARDT